MKLHVDNFGTQIVIIGLGKYGSRKNMLVRYHLFKGKLPLMNRALDAYALRQQTTAKNIANSSSPHYRPERVKFEEFFRDIEVVIPGTKTDELHIPVGKPQPLDVEGEKMAREIPQPEIYFSGETHVNIDKEMSELAQNQIRFRFASRAVKKYFTGIGNAITGNNQ